MTWTRMYARCAVVVLCCAISGVLRASTVTHPFSVRDDISLTEFGDENTNLVAAITPSPMQDLAAVYSQHGLLRENLLDASIRIYRMSELASFIGKSDAVAPRPLWILRFKSAEDGPIIQNIQWLRNASGLAFLEKVGGGSLRLMVADIGRKRILRLSKFGQDVTAYSVLDIKRFAYTTRSKEILTRATENERAAAIRLTGRSLNEALFSPNEVSSAAQEYDRSDLWASQSGIPEPVMDPTTGRPLVLYSEGQQAIAISPDGRKLLTALPIREIPKSWETSYPSSPGSPYHFDAGVLEASALHGNRAARYAIISLTSGSVDWASQHPVSTTAGWYTGIVHPSWSEDGRYVILPDTFVRDGGLAPATPCSIAILEVNLSKTHCLLKAGRLFTQRGTYEPGFVWNLDAHFRSSTQISVLSKPLGGLLAPKQQTFEVTPHGQWVLDSSQPSNSRNPHLGVSQGLNKPPVLTASDGAGRERALWNPNAWLDRVDIGHASIFKWRDESNREWTGGLYLPRGYIVGHRYPLVIQTHGFVEDQFRPSGVLPTAFAARELAAAGIAVLQVRDCPVNDTPFELPCQLAGYRTALKNLEGQGIVDSNRVGIIGFSRTVSYALAALVDDRLEFAAASVTDGVDHGYFQYLYDVDRHGNEIARDTDAVIGVPSAIKNLSLWIGKAPTFNLIKVRTPLQVVAEGEDSLLFMWEPYAVLRYLRKPVDMVLLHTDEHVLTNPKLREASQGGTVDWFRFWLQGYEDPAQAKREQYANWEALCDLQVQQVGREHAFCVPSKGK